MEGNVALQVVHEQASIPIKKEKVDQKEGQTWAQIAAAKWMETHSREEQWKRDSFGKPPRKFRQLKLNTKSQVVKVEVKEVAEQELPQVSLFSRPKPRPIQITKMPPTGPKSMRAHGRGTLWAMGTAMM